MRPWKRPPSKSLPGGPRMVKCLQRTVRLHTKKTTNVRSHTVSIGRSTRAYLVYVHDGGLIECGGSTNQRRFPTINTPYIKGYPTSEGAAVKSIEGSACISLASSSIRRTPGDLVLRGIALIIRCAVVMAMTRSREGGGMCG